MDTGGAEHWQRARGRLAKILVEKHDDGMLKAFGLWTFGDMGKPDEKKPAQGQADGGAEE